MRCIGSGWNIIKISVDARANARDKRGSHTCLFGERRQLLCVVENVRDNPPPDLALESVPRHNGERSQLLVVSLVVLHFLFVE
jgi:hypothetical protein